MPSDTPVSFRVALALQALAPDDEAAAREYVTTVIGASRSRTCIHGSNFAAWLKDHMEAGLEPVLSPTTDLGKRALQRARQFLEERALHAWVRDANQSKGLAPKGKNIWREYRRSAGDQLHWIAVRCGKGTEKAARARQQWVRRWARRWTIRKGQFKAGDRMSAAELESKARPTAGAQFLIHGLPIFRTVGARLIFLGVQKMRPFLASLC